MADEATKDAAPNPQDDGADKHKNTKGATKPPENGGGTVLPDDELKRIRDEARREERERIQREQDAAKAEQDRKDAEKRGEYEQVIASLKEESDRLKLDAKGKDVDLRLLNHLAAKHPDYATSAKWIRSAVTFDASTTDETLDKRIADAVAEYVKDNPRAPQGGGGAPPAHPGRKPAGAKNDTDRDPTRLPNGNRILSPAMRF
jgi:hypothetical protein